MQEQTLLRIEDVALEGALATIGDKTSIRILLVLMHGKKRFSEFDLSVSSKTLSSRLKMLEEQGLVTRTLHAEVPPRVEYALTEKGIELVNILEGVLAWETSWA